jgi:prepilin-type N-terminal cleavage/methylation domain-containing protein
MQKDVQKQIVTVPGKRMHNGVVMTYMKEDKKMKKKLEQFKKDQSGFTLVELIIVLVILAILAALLVPALLGYIDQARTSKYLEEARSVFTAIQAVNDENYAKGGSPVKLTAGSVTADDLDRVNKLVSPTAVTSCTINYLEAYNASSTDQDAIHKMYTVSYLTSLIFKSQDGNTITISMNSDGTWITDGIVITPPTPVTP